MKILCLILSMMVLILSARPCCTDRNCDSTLGIKQASTNGQSKEKDCAGCSPFFSCGSCAGFVLSKPVAHAMAAIAEHPVRVYPPYIQQGYKDISPAIWQPPQLS